MTHRVLPTTATPELSVPLVSGGQWTLSEQTPKAFTLIVFYRGYHCPKCKEQLSDLESKLGEFEEIGVSVLAVSMDGDERALKTRDEWELPKVPLAYGLDGDTARKWGLYISEKMDKPESQLQEPAIFCEPGMFLVKPDGTLYSASIQTMPFARPNFADVIGAVKFVTSSGYPARGNIL